MTGAYEGMSAVLYARVSTDDKDQTTETQIRNMRAWCAEQGVEIVGEYDEEKSAKDLDRPKFDACIGRIARGGVNILLAWNESRLSRDMDDMSTITKIVRSYGTVIRYVANSVEPENSTGKLLNSINTWQAQEERKKLSLNTKVGMETAKAHGVHCGRMLAMCWSHKVAECESMIAKGEGCKRPTKIVSIDVVMDLAKQGYTINRASSIVGVSRNTLKDNLSAEGRLAEYLEISEEVRRNCHQGGTSTRGGKTAESMSTRGEVA